MAERSGSKTKRRAPEAASPEPWLAWVASAIGLLITAAVLGILLRALLEGGGTAPEVRVERGAISAHASGFTVEIRARNMSGTTIAQVEVEGVLKQGGRAVETARATFDFLPRHSARGAGLFFSNDPRPLQLELRAVGYALP
jgi:uncharacterized protein (TIGR02588 family)